MARTKTTHLKMKRGRIVRDLPPAGLTLRGSLYMRFLKCGKAYCRCKKPGARGHGPYYYLTINRGVGNTVSIQVPKEALDEVAQWVSNYRKLRKGLEAISEINLDMISESKKKWKKSLQRGKRK